ncbi:hypothetical protein CEB3_c16700 [Peptococcaceae bacterium CEB3]|nr:hypothetical protein CEB3_c16700 [Peptococcaceae bacterium CEB3]
MVEHGRTPHHLHDKGYKELFSDSETFLEFIQSFIPAAWTRDLRAENLIRIDKSFILQDFQDKEADVVYRLQHSSSSVIFYILLELQSSVDYLMPFRLLLYMTEIWRDAFHNTPEKDRRRKGFRLPVVVPIVLYNGVRKWTATSNFQGLFVNPEDYIPYVLDFRYYLVNVRSFAEGELLAFSNLVATIFALDQRMEAEELLPRLRRFMNVLQRLKPKEFQQFKNWMHHVLNERLAQPLQEDAKALLEEANPQEVERMIYNLERTLRKLERTAKQEGREKGIEQGKQEGILTGKIRAKQDDITLFLSVRYGEVSRSLQEAARQIQDVVSLEELLKALYTASDFSEVKAVVERFAAQDKL